MVTLLVTYVAFYNLVVPSRSSAVNVVHRNVGDLVVDVVFALSLFHCCILGLDIPAIGVVPVVATVAVTLVSSVWVPFTASASTIASTTVASTSAVVATTVFLPAMFITDGLPAVASSMSVLFAVAAISIELFFYFESIGQHDNRRFFFFSQGCHEGLVATDILNAQVMKSSGGIGYRSLEM